MILISLILAIAGFSALAAAMRRHAKQIGLTVVLPRPLRLGGSGLLVASFVVLLAEMDWRIAAIMWIGQAGLAAAVCVLMLHLKARAAALPIDRARQVDRQGGKARSSRTDSLTSPVNTIEV